MRPDDRERPCERGDLPSVVRTVEITTAEEFVSYLRPSNPHWLPPTLRDAALVNPTGWVFRGKREAAWTLLPKALRPNALKPYAEDWECGEQQPGVDRVDALARQAYFEITAVEWFLELADEVGIVAPIHYAMRNEISNLKSVFKKNGDRPGVTRMSDLSLPIPPPSLAEAFAVAQHHGIPTRLMDWTWSPLVAAYFAALGAWRARSDESISGHMAVWALNVREIGIDTGTRRVKMVVASGGQNDYLRSQSGLFLYDEEANQHFLLWGRWPDLDAAVAACWQGDQAKIPFLKIIAPWSIAKDVLRILFHERITPAHLMPTLDNVAETVLYYQELFDRLHLEP